MYRFKTKEEMLHYNDLSGQEVLKHDMYMDSVVSDFDYYFKKVELPVVELKEQSFEILGKKAEINYTENYNKLYSGWNIGLYDDFGLSVEIYIGKTDVIKSVKDFNEKCALLFGFYLKEV